MTIFELIDVDKAISVIASNTNKLEGTRLNTLKAIDAEFYDDWMLHLKPLLKSRFRNELRRYTGAPTLDFALPAWGTIQEATVNVIIDTVELYLMLMYNVDAHDKHVYQQIINLIAQNRPSNVLLKKVLRIMDDTPHHTKHKGVTTLSERVFYYLFFTSNCNLFK